MNDKLWFGTETKRDPINTVEMIFNGVFAYVKPISKNKTLFKLIGNMDP